MKNYQCDYCGQSISDIKTEIGNDFPAGWLTVIYHGSQAGLHFCSRKCLENYLFKTKNVI